MGRGMRISDRCYNLKWDDREHGQGKSGKVAPKKVEKETGQQVMRISIERVGHTGRMASVKVLEWDCDCGKNRFLAEVREMKSLVCFFLMGVELSFSFRYIKIEM